MSLAERIDVADVADVAEPGEVLGRRPTSAAALEPPLLSVVVCSLDGERTIAACLDALQRQTIRDRIEIIVVDDGSTDCTASIARRDGIELVSHEVNRGLSAARNSGIDRSRADLIAFTDDDCVPDPTWAERTVAAFERDLAVQGVGGEVDVLHHRSIVQRYLASNIPLRPLEIDFGGDAGFATRLRLYVRPPAGHGLRQAYSLVGASMSFRAGTLREIGGFDDRITFGGDDEDICRRVRERHGAGSLVVDDDVRVAHDFDSSLRDTLRRSYMYGVGNGREWARHGGVPSLRPTPLLAGLVGAVLLPVRTRAAVVAAVAVPLLFFRRGLIRAVRTRAAEPLLWPVIELSQEIAADAGFARGWWAAR